MPGKRIVLDTNIWLSYIITSRLTELTQIILDNNLQVYISPALIREISYNLQKRKINKYLTLPLSNYLAQVRNLVINIKPEKNFDRSPDPADNFLFDLSLKAKVDYIVTGDKLLFQIIIPDIKIITLREFREMYPS